MHPADFIASATSDRKLILQFTAGKKQLAMLRDSTWKPCSTKSSPGSCHPAQICARPFYPPSHLVCWGFSHHKGFRLEAGYNSAQLLHNTMSTSPIEARWPAQCVPHPPRAYVTDPPAQSLIFRHGKGKRATSRFVNNRKPRKALAEHYSDTRRLLTIGLRVTTPARRDSQPTSRLSSH
jgi:hypothetical protein